MSDTDKLINALLTFSNEQVLYKDLPDEVRRVCRQAAEELAAAKREIEEWRKLAPHHLGSGHSATDGNILVQWVNGDAHPYCSACKGPAMSMGGCMWENCPIKL